MCGSCLPTISRRTAIGALAGAVLAAGTVRTARAQTAPIEVGPGLSIQPRDAWAQGRPPTGPLAPENDVRFLLVHHTASANGADPVGVLRVAYDFHTGPEKGWPDVAYNFFVDQFGVVWEGRAGSLAGPVEASATGGSQGFAQLVCLLGDFTGQLPTPAALSSLNLVLAWLADRHGLDTTPGATTEFTSRGSNRWPEGTTVVASTISGHRDMSQTACPGDTFYPHLVSNVVPQVDLIRAGRALPTASSPPPPPTLPSATSPPTTAPPTTAPPTTAPPATAAPTSVAPTTVPAATTAPTTVSPTTAGSVAEGSASTALSPPGSTAPTSSTTNPPDSSGSPGGVATIAAVGAAAGAAALVAGGLVHRRRTTSLTEHDHDHETRNDP